MLYKTDILLRTIDHITDTIFFFYLKTVAETQMNTSIICLKVAILFPFEIKRCALSLFIVEFSLEFFKPSLKLAFKRNQTKQRNKAWARGGNIIYN